MKILFFAYFTSVDALHGAELDLMQRHLDAGDDVTILYCDGNKDGCESNHQCSVLSCYRCKLKRRHGLALLDGDVEAHPFTKWLSEDDKALCEKLSQTSYESKEAMKEWMVEDFDLGYAVLSSLISRYRNAHIVLEDHQDYVRRISQIALSVYYSVKAYLREMPTSKVYVMNGRLAGFRAAVRACQFHSIPFATFDEGQDRQHFALYENSNPHDLDMHEKRTIEVWNRADKDTREAIGKKFFEDRVKGQITGWNHGFISGQKSGQLPSSWSPDRRNIVIFDSSEDECAAIGPRWDNPIYKDQLDGMSTILRELSERRIPEDLRFYIRMHPHMSGCDNFYTRTVLALGSENVEVIPPDSPVSTYELMRGAEKILTFGSTVGIEAVFWGKPSILAGEAYYGFLNATHNPTSHEELMDLLVSRDTEGKDGKGPLIYGYYWETFGEPYRYCESNGPSSTGIEFRGHRVRGNLLIHHGLRVLADIESRVRRFFSRTLTAST